MWFRMWGTFCNSTKFSETLQKNWQMWDQTDLNAEAVIHFSIFKIIAVILDTKQIMVGLVASMSFLPIPDSLFKTCFEVSNTV